jgi:flavin-dependent dehydrogenase
MSTHFIQPPGVDMLDRIGLGTRARAVAPAARKLRFALDEVEVIVDYGAGRHGLCVRRSTLDPWLQELAESAGAEFRDRHRVVDLLREDERVTGVVVDGPSGREEIRARMVVGADGPHSTVAKLTKAPEYLVAHSNRGGFYQYYPAPPRWENEWDATLEHRGDGIRYLFRADGNLLTMIYLGRQAEVATWGRDWRSKLHEKLLESPSTRPLVEGKEPVGQGCGLIKARYFYRQPIGPGYALVGDAGHFKDFVTGQGMTDAFLDAERLARAIVDGRDVALERFWRERDVATLPLHYDALQQGLVGFNSAFLRYTFARVAKRPDIANRVARVIDRKLSPYEMLPTRFLLTRMAGALLRGRFDVLQGFLAGGKTIAAEQKEIAARQVLLDDVERRFVAEGTLTRAPTARAA